MYVHISASDGVPIYQQIVQQIKRLVACGRLAPGEELPPIRVLAAQLVVNANTVARAYRELAEAGVLTNRRTSGTFVADGALKQAREQCFEALTDQVDSFLTEARQLHVGVDEVVDLVRKRDGAAHHRKEK